MQKTLVNMVVYLLALLCLPMALSSGQENGKAVPIEGPVAASAAFPSGVYTVRVPEGKTSAFAVKGANGTPLQERTLVGGAAYAFYLPEGASVMLGPDAELSQRNEDYRGWHELPPGGTHRVYAAERVMAGFFTVTVAKGAKSGYVLITTRENDMGQGLPPERIDLLPGLVALPDLMEGQFMELVDCEVEVIGSRV